MQRAVPQEEERHDESLRPIAALEDLGEILETDTDRREGDPKHRHEEAKGERGRGPMSRGFRRELEDAEEVCDPPDEDDEDPTDEERKFRDARRSAQHPGRRKQKAPSSSRCPAIRGSGFQKAFMPHAATRPFRSRSLVRSRIGAFRASDAGSNPAGSMLFYQKLMVLRPSVAVPELAFVGTPARDTSWVRRAFIKFRTRQLPSYIVPVGLTFYRRDSIGPFEGSCMNASFARHVERPARGPARPRLPRLMILIAAILIVSVLPATARANNSETRPTIVLVHGAWASPPGWDIVVAGLEKDGFTTVTPTLGLLSIAGDVAIVRAVLDGISGPKILVGHSYGGIVISNAAYGRSDVLGLVFSAAFVPEQGDSIFSLGAGFHTSAAFNHLICTRRPSRRRRIEGTGFDQNPIRPRRC